MQKLIHNSSMPRSGSELLQVVLHQNPKIYGSATSPLLEYQFAARGNLNLPEVKSQNPELMQKAFLNMCGNMAQSYYEPITDKPIICDKNRGWSHYYEWVEQWNPNPKMICMVRDLRGIIGSLESIYQKNRHHPESIDNPAQIENMTVGERAAYWLRTQPVGLALKRTLDTFQKGLDKKILWIRYEDLVDDPKKELDRVYDYIGEEPFSHDFKNIVKTVEENDSYYGIFGKHSVSRSIDQKVKSNWKEILPKEIASEIRSTFDWYFEAFGY